MVLLNKKTDEKLKILSILSAIALLSSCQNFFGAKFEIKNNTNHVIDSINIKSVDHEGNSNYLQLSPGESQSYWFNMIKIPQVDGSYLLTFRTNPSNIETKEFGYFTNGSSLEAVTIIQIESDTVLIEPVYNEY